ncbi:MAG: T9SS type A sorting domain-containing protein [Bacteroidales bacterium]|nr:T9SS type A sorting domain-containing protein [Bacteroidales bacterium]
MRELITTILILVSISVCSIAQTYQLPNGGFDAWDGNGSDDEPTHWNAFPSAACDLSGLAALGCGTATSTRHEKSTDIRPGSLGSYSCRLFATSALGIIANGTITTGQIRIGSTTAASPENYNITRTANSSLNQSLNAKPDSIVFWAKFVCPSSTQKARISAIIHDNYDYRDPEEGDANATNHVVGKAIENFTRGDQTWQRHSVAFDYDYPSANPHYILLTFTSNMVQGEGSTSDQLFIDDVELVYNTNLLSIKVDNTLINGFNSNVYSYNIQYQCGETPAISAVAESLNASVSINQPNEFGVSTIEVTNGDQSSVYTININYFHTTIIEDEICQGELYNSFGFNLGQQNTVGLFNHYSTIYESATCDSIYNLILTVHPTYQNDTNYIMICETGEYNFFGQIITEPGIYDTTLITTNGCDSTMVLDLSVGEFYRSFINESICHGEYYIENGFNMGISGSDTLYYTAINGCDSLVILNLTVNPIHSTEIFDTISQGSAYTKNGFEIFTTNIPGDYIFTNTYFNVYGCDSTVNLNLTITEVPEDSTNNSGTEFGFMLFPNPASDEIIVKAENYIDFSLGFIIYDIFGKILEKGNINTTETALNIAHFAPGIYFIKIFDSNDKYNSLKFIKY